jgi:hypothetical protein
MEKNKINCDGCKFKIARIVGEIDCGIRQEKRIRGRMCLATNVTYGLYWIHVDEQSSGKIRDVSMLKGKE